MRYCVYVPGLPKPAGSKRGFLNRKTGKVMIVEATKGAAAWRRDVQAAWLETYGREKEVLTCPIGLELVFRLPRPKGHFGTGRNSDKLRPSAPARPIRKPDLDKLVRAVQDALTHVAWRDDAQVVSIYARKDYADDTGVGVVIFVRPISTPSYAPARGPAGT